MEFWHPTRHHLRALPSAIKEDQTEGSLGRILSPGEGLLLHSIVNEAFMMSLIGGR